MLCADARTYEDFEHEMSRTFKATLPCIQASVNQAFRAKSLRPLREFLIGEWSSAFPLRGFLVRLGFEIGGGSLADVREAAAAIEMAQLSTLVVDDVIDMSKWRNGPTIVQRFGSGIGMLAGEMLKSAASSLMAKATSSADMNGSAAFEEFEATFRDVCAGQVLDLSYEKSGPIHEKRYLEMIALTTGRFLEGAIAVGGLLAACSPQTISALRCYGRSAGIAFQIYDDIFDLLPLPTHDKEFANDLKRRKQRLPWIHFRDTCSPAELRKLSLNGHVTDRRAREIVGRMLRRGSIDYCIQTARQFSERARRQIGQIGSHEAVLSYFLDLLEEDEAALVAQLRIRNETLLQQKR